MARSGAGASARRRASAGLAVAVGAGAAWALSGAWAQWPRRPWRAAAGARVPAGAAEARRPLTAARLRDRSSDVLERPPPEPRGRGPRTERDVANDVVFGVVAVELLFNHDRLDMEVGRAFRRAVYDPVLERLQLYSNSSTSEARAPAKSWRLQDRVLERQFSLSNYFTEEVATDLRMRQEGEPMMPLAQVDTRAILRDANVEATDDPVSSALIAWSAHQLWVGDAKVPTSLCRRRPFGYAAEKPGVSEWLLPVFVEHDRSSHAERMALLSVGEVIKQAGGKLHPDSPVRGSTAVYASHTPCISCLAVFCQFKRKLPNVKLYFLFDTWGDTRRWIGDACLHEDLLRDEEEED